MKPVCFMQHWAMVTARHRPLSELWLHMIPLGHMWYHDDVIKWKHFPRCRPLVRGIHRSPVNSPHKGQWRGAMVFALICAWRNGWVNNGEAGDLKRNCAHYDVIVIRLVNDGAHGIWNIRSREWPWSYAPGNHSHFCLCICPSCWKCFEHTEGI